eukprot:g21024.t1
MFVGKKLYGYVRFAADAGDRAVGFPVVRADGLWKWPLKRLTLADGALRYSAYPTGYAGSRGHCCLGDATSGTRAYRWETLVSLLKEVDPATESLAALLVQLDLLGQQRLGPHQAAMACAPLQSLSSCTATLQSVAGMVPPVVEEDYLDQFAWPLNLAQQKIYSFEVSGTWLVPIDAKVTSSPVSPLMRHWALVMTNHSSARQAVVTWLIADLLRCFLSRMESSLIMQWTSFTSR